MKRVELLSLEPVWKVVGLDADQKGAILRLRERYQQRGMKAFERSAALGPDEMAKMIAQWETTDRESLDKILSSQQRNRLEQIRAQVILRNDGPSGLQDDAFESLKITEAQHKQMAERLKEGRKPLVERFRNQTWAGAMGRINEVLDVKQRALLRKLLGKLVVRPMVT